MNSSHLCLLSGALFISVLPLGELAAVAEQPLVFDAVEILEGLGATIKLDNKQGQDADGSRNLASIIPYWWTGGDEGVDLIEQVCRESGTLP